MEPVAGRDVVLLSTQGQPNDTARLSAPGLTADVTGSWARRTETLEIVYAASSATTIPIASSSTWKAQRAVANHAWDISVEEPGNAIGRPLLGTPGLTLGPGDRHTVQIEYDRPEEGDRPDIGDEVTITVPMPGRALPVRFRLAGE